MKVNNFSCMPAHSDISLQILLCVKCVVDKMRFQDNLFSKVYK